MNEELPLHFHDFYDRVHIGEKWFFIDLERKHFYLSKNEQAPLRRYQSKRHHLKMMFLVAVARPRFDHKKNQWLGLIVKPGLLENSANICLVI